jgi:lipoprotein-releasing system permease protein
VKPGPTFFIALRYLLGRAREGGRYLRGAAAGIALSLIPIVVTLIVADGMIRGITDRYLELGTGHLQVYNHFYPGEIEEAAAALKDFPGVRGVWAEQQGVGVLVGPQGKTGAAIRAVDPSFWEQRAGQEYLEILSGTIRLDSPGEVLLGEELARTAGLEAGDTVRIMTLRLNDEGRNIPRLMPFTVKGIVSSGYRELDSLWCIMSYEGGRQFLSSRLTVPYLIVKIDDPYRKADEMLVSFYQKLGLGFGIYTWKELQRSQYSSYESTKQLLLFIMAIIVVVAAVNVSSATSMLAIERSRDIAIFKAFGAAPRETSRIFIYASLLTGLLGAVLGISLGLLIAVHINPLIRCLEGILGFFFWDQVRILDPGYYLQDIPIIIDWTTVFLIGIFTVLCSILASWFPARRAGTISPMDLIRRPRGGLF